MFHHIQTQCYKIFQKKLSLKNVYLRTCFDFVVQKSNKAKTNSELFDEMIHQTYCQAYLAVYFVIDAFFSFSTPDWVENVMQSGGDFEQIHKLYFTSQTNTTEMKKLRSGFLLKEILDQSRKMQGFQSIEPPKLRLYFAHDITLVDMLLSLGLPMVRIGLLSSIFT